jgi:hypothetical protein
MFLPSNHLFASLAFDNDCWLFQDVSGNPSPNPRATNAPRPMLLAHFTCSWLHLHVPIEAIVPVTSAICFLHYRRCCCCCWCSWCGAPPWCCTPLISGVRANPRVQVNEVRALLEDLDHSPPLAKDVKYEPPSHPRPPPPPLVLSPHSLTLTLSFSSPLLCFLSLAPTLSLHSHHFPVTQGTALLTRSSKHIIQPTANK